MSEKIVQLNEEVIKGQLKCQPPVNLQPARQNLLFDFLHHLIIPPNISFGKIYLSDG